jgi:hypothetical protein
VLTASHAGGGRLGDVEGRVLSFDISAPVAKVGLVLGMDVVYEMSGKQWLQEFESVITACPWPGAHPDTMDGPCGRYNSIDAFRIPFADALTAARGGQH